MEQIELNDEQRDILSALVERYRRTDVPVSSEAIAEDIDRNPGTLRNKIRSMKALGLVEGIPGVKGGYKPTVKAYEVLDAQTLDNPEALTLVRDYDRITTTVVGIDFLEVYHPEQCRARLQFEGSVEAFEPGDAILVGPTPVTKLVVGGEVRSVDPARKEVLVDVIQVHAPLADE